MKMHFKLLLKLWKFLLTKTHIVQRSTYSICLGNVGTLYAE